MHRRHALAGTLAALLLVSLPVTFASFPLSILVREGDTVTGVGLVTLINTVAVNDLGSWLVEADTNADSSSDVVMLRSSGLYLRENQSLAAPPGAAISSFDSVNLNSGGHSGWNFFLRNMPTTADSGIYFDAGLVLQESDISIAPELSPNTPYIGFFDAKINNANQIAVVASVDDPIIASTVDRALVILDLDGSGELLSETAFAKEGQALPGQTEVVVDFGTGPHETAFNNLGQMLYFADLTGDATTDGVIYLDLTRVAQEGMPSAVTGRNYEILSSRGLDVNNHGEAVFKANLTGDTTTDDDIIVDGKELVHESGTLPVITPFILTSLGSASGPVAIDDERNVLWYGDWNDPDTTKDTGLFINDVLIVRKGVAIGGATITSIVNVQDGYAMSRNGSHVVFKAGLSDGTDAAISVKVTSPPPVPDGWHVPGVSMKASLNPNGTDIDVTWDTTSCATSQYNLFYGSLASVSTLAYTGAACDLGVTGQATFTPPVGDVFFLIASEDADAIEGVHGYDSRPRPRHASAGGQCGVIGQIRSSACESAVAIAGASPGRTAVPSREALP